MVTPSEIKQWIEGGLSECEASVSGDGHHFDARVIFDGFEGKSIIERHRMVYDALGARMGSTIHALSLKTLTTKEAGV